MQVSGNQAPGLDRGVVGDHHHVAAVDRADADHHAGRRSAAVLLVEALGHPEAELQEGAPGIAQRLDPLARRHLALRALLVLRLQAAAEADAVLLLAQLLHLAAASARPAARTPLPLTLLSRIATCPPSVRGIIRGAGPKPIKACARETCHQIAHGMSTCRKIFW